MRESSYRHSLSTAALCACLISSSKLTFCCAARLRNQFDELVRRDRHLRDVHAERRQRVLDGRDQSGGSRNDAELADALGAERVVRRWRLLIERFEARQLGRGRQQII